MEKENEVHYYPNANWASIKGNFTPESLRQIADEIETKHQEFQGRQQSKEMEAEAKAEQTGKD